jgi:hypothetical protein
MAPAETRQFWGDGGRECCLGSRGGGPKRLQGASSAGRLQGAGVLMPDGQQAATPPPMDPPPALESFLPAPPAE